MAGERKEENRKMFRFLLEMCIEPSIGTENNGG
jgi:hypothetical protein